jgi:glycine/D-amino acid oxidase-like deaminating enzyme
MGNTFDVIVVGAGYIGCSVAYRLCAAGLKTALFDLGSMAAGASRANFGNVQIQDLELNKSLELIRLARLRFADLEQELDWKVGLRRIGGLLLIENESQWKLMEARLKVVRSEGILSELVSSERLRELEPHIDASALLGGLYHDHEGQVDPFQFIWGHLVQARHLGLHEYYHSEVIGFDIRNGRIEGIVTSRGQFNAGAVVLCTGANTPQLGRLLGREWDIRYVLGQAMVTDPVEPILQNHISSASFFEQQPAGQDGAVNVGLAIGQSQHGHLLLGEAMISGEVLRRDVPSGALAAVAGCVLRYFPSFRKLRVRRSWSAPVAYTSDACPWFGPVAGIEGLFLATAFRSTVIVAPLIGEMVVQLVTSGKCDLIIDDFLPERNSAHAY